ncbi:MAG: hypothetical protein AB7V27_08005 [Candidatus Binatia bacterium]
MLASLSCIAWPAKASGQQTIFNVPSPDVLDAGKFYLETDQYFRPWKTESGRAANFFVRGVAGVGYDVEAGINTGPFDYIHRNNPFIDATVKWRPVSLEFGGKEQQPGVFALFGGTQVGVGLRADVKGDVRNFSYGAASVRVPGLGTRVGVGPYFATPYVFDNHSRGGALATFEQPVQGVDGLVLAADWFSGDGALASPGAIYSTGPFVFYLAYGLANTGRKDDLVTFEVGYYFP